MKKPAHFRRLVLVSLMLAFFLGCKPLFAFQGFVDDFSQLNDENWMIYRNSGSVDVVNGGVLISNSTPSYTFPYMFTKGNIFPADNYEFKMVFTFPVLTNDFGIGFALSDNNPPNRLERMLDARDYAFIIWNEGGGRFGIYTDLCPSNDQFCTEGVARRLSFTGYTSHRYDLRLLKIEQVYKVIIKDVTNGEEGFTSLFESSSAHQMISTLWIGLPQLVGDPPKNWGSILVHHVSVVKAESPAEIILVPGMGGSWDIHSLKYGVPGVNWQIPPFVPVYDNLISSLENAGYVRDSNLFVFGYDWRRPITETVETLRNYLVSKELDSKKVVFVGHSMGGLVARMYGQQYGTDKVEKIITIGSPHLGSANVYGIWEGNEFWKEVWSIKAGIALTANNRLADEKPIDALRRQIPSFKDVLPTYDYLRKDGVLVPVEDMKQKNTYLPQMNQNVGIVDGVLHAITGSGEHTIYQVNVRHRNKFETVSGLWEDGKPTKESPFVFGNGDDTVLELSALAGFTNRWNVGNTHYMLPANRQVIEKIFDILGLDKTKVVANSIDDEATKERLFLASLKSPGRLEVCNISNVCDGNLGYYVYDEKLFMLPGYDGKDLRVRVYADGQTGSYRLEMADIDKTALWSEVEGNLEIGQQTDTYNVVDGSLTPKKKLDCFLYGWRRYSHPVFKNQGACVSFAEKGTKTELRSL